MVQKSRGSSDSRLRPVVDIVGYEAEQVHSALGGRAICVPTCQGRRRNPVLLTARFFTEILALSGDVGACHNVERHTGDICKVKYLNDAVLINFDTPRVLDR